MLSYGFFAERILITSQPVEIGWPSIEMMRSPTNMFPSEAGDEGAISVTWAGGYLQSLKRIPMKTCGAGMKPIFL